jgi:uncharacterized membrane protein HdeD (DUF308 family)
MADEHRSTMDVVRQSRILAYSIGLATVIVGAVLLFWPEASVRVVALIVGVISVVVGIGESFDAITTHRKGSYWGLLFLRGLVNIAVGVALVFWPGITVSVIVWVWGLGIIVTGILGLIASWQVPKDMGRTELRVRSGVGALVGVLVVVWPSATVRVLTVVVGVGLVVFGLLLFWSGFELRRGDDRSAA